MKNDQASEDKLMSELDGMYLRVADLERGRIATRVDNPDVYEQNSDERLATHEKVIPFPVRGTPVVLGEPSEDRASLGTKLRYRSYLMVSLTVILLLLASIIILVELTLVPQDSEEMKSRQLIFPVQEERLAPAHREYTIQGVEKRGQKAELLPDQSTKPGLSSIQKRHYTVQIGAFQNWKNSRELLATLQKKGLDSHWDETDTRDRGVLYRVFSGYFTDRREATEFMRDRGILKDYPGSFIREISTKEGGRNTSPRLNSEE